MVTSQSSCLLMFAKATSGLERERQRLVFQAVQPVFSQLLENAGSATHLATLCKQASSLMERDVLLRDHMHLCLDYVLFPFQFFLPAITSTRQDARSRPAARENGNAMPGMASALAAEAALHCLQVMLANTQLQTAAQLRGLVSFLVDIVHLAPGPQTNEHMCLSTLEAVQSVFSGAPAAARAAAVEGGNWDVTVGYLVHGLLGVAEREQQGRGFGTLQMHVNACSRANHDGQV